LDRNVFSWVTINNLLAFKIIIINRPKGHDFDQVVSRDEKRAAHSTKLGSFQFWDL